MTQKTVKIEIPFETLLASVEELSLSDKRRLWEMLEAALAEVEEEKWEREPAVQAEIQEARAGYEGGDYVTIDEYVAQRREKA